MKAASSNTKPSKMGPPMTQGDVGPAIRKMMLPMMIGMLAMISYNVADTYFIGQLGTLELAAISFTFPVAFIVVAVMMALSIGTSSVCARLFGADRHEEVDRVASHAILLGLVAGAAVVTLGLSTIDPLFTLLGADESTLPIIRRYMHIYYWGSIFLVIPMISNAVLRSSGNAKTPAMIMLCAAIFNIALDPLLIFGLWGFPRMEVEGAAIATIIANAGTLIASLYVVYYRDKIIRLRALYLHLIIDSWKQILHVGLPSLTSSLIAPITTAFITYQMAQFGQEAIAGFGIAARVEGLALLALMALSAATVPFIGQNFGARRLDRVEQGIHWCFRFSLRYGLIMAAIITISSGFIASAFTDSTTAIAVAKLQMLIVPISYFALGASMVSNSAFNALGKPMPAMYISLSRTILVYAPLAFLLAHYFGVIGIFIAACTANFISGGIGFFWLRKTIRTAQRKSPSQAKA